MAVISALASPGGSSASDASRRLHGAVERWKEEYSENFFASAFELPVFSALVSLVFQYQGLQVFSVFVLRTQPLHFGRKISLYLSRQFLRSAGTAVSTTFYSNSFHQIDTLSRRDSFVIVDLKSPCRLTVAQFFFLHGFITSLLNSGAYPLFGIPFGIGNTPLVRSYIIRSNKWGAFQMQKTGSFTLYIAEYFLTFPISKDNYPFTE